MATQKTTSADCRQKAQECRSIAKSMKQEEHRNLLHEMAESWDRIADDLQGDNGKE